MGFCLSQSGKRHALGAIYVAALAFGAALDVAAAVAQVPALPSPQPGLWDLSLDDTNRKCRLSLREDAVTKDARSLAMPAGCRRAMPILGRVYMWKAAGDTLALGEKNGEEVLRFASAGPGGFAATGPDGETYRLVAADADAPLLPSRQQVAQAAPTPGFQTPTIQKPGVAVAQAKPAVLDAPKAAELAGRYAVLREKDTGCMMTFDATAGGLKGKRAQLAPACRDQGVVIFDPAGWTVEKGRLVITARKGHQFHFDRQPDGTWLKDAKEGKALSLRKM